MLFEKFGIDKNLVKLSVMSRVHITSGASHEGAVACGDGPKPEGNSVEFGGAAT